MMVTSEYETILLASLKQHFNKAYANVHTVHRINSFNQSPVDGHKPHKISASKSTGNSNVSSKYHAGNLTYNSNIKEF